MLRARRAARLVETIRLVGRGDREALGDLYDATSPYVFGLALSVLRSPQLAVAATQEVYSEVWRLAPQFDPRDSSVLAWLMSLAHRLVAELGRPLSNAPLPERDIVMAGRADRGDGEVFARLEAEWARRAVDGLEEEERQAVTLAYFGGYSHTEIGRILGLSPSTVKIRIRDGLIRLRDAMGVAS